MTIETFDADGRRKPPGTDWPMVGVVAALVIVPALAAAGIAWLLDANLSPARILVGLAALVALAALFALREWCWRVERQERIAYEAKLRAKTEWAHDATRDRHRVVIQQQRIIDDLIANPCPTCGKAGEAA